MTFGPQAQGLNSRVQQGQMQYLARQCVTATTIEIGLMLSLVHMDHRITGVTSTVPRHKVLA